MTRRSRRKALLAAVVAAGSLALAGTAQAWTTIGSDLSVVPTLGVGNDHTAATLTPPTATLNPLTAPSSGVITQIRLRYGNTDANPGSVAFRILSGSNPFTGRVASADGAELRFPLPPNTPATGGVVEYRPVDSGGRPIGIPIATGERLGVAQQKTGVASIVAVAAGASVGYTTGQHLTGAFAYTIAAGYEMTLQGVLEPDADGDRRGDDTQDRCPSVANDPATGQCPRETVTVPGPERVITVEAAPRCRVPLLRGLSRNFAGRLLTASGCRLGAVTSRAVRRGPSGRVVGQAARAGTVLAAGASVGITLSRRVARRGRRG